MAGSEKLSKTGATGISLEEGKLINQSLLWLGNVINALTENVKFVPYWNSKLTQILQDILGGNSKTTIIITCSPSKFNYQETISTLRFGSWVKTIKNQVNKNVVIPRSELIKEIKELKIKLKVA